MESATISAPRASKGFYEFDYVRFGPAAVKKLQNEVDALEEQLAKRQTNQERRLFVIDSLRRETEEKDETIARLEEQLQQDEAWAQGLDGNGGGKLAAIAQSLMVLDEEELGPILNRLSDSQLVELYKASNRIRRAKLMRSLDPGKAATLLRRVM